MGYKMAWSRCCERDLQHCLGQWPFCSKKHKKPTEVIYRTSPGGGRGGYFSTSNPKNCDADMPAIPVKPAPQTIKCESPGWPVSDTRTQWHSSPGFFLPGRYPLSSRSCWSLCVHTAQSPSMSNLGKGLCGLLQHKWCVIMTIISGI